MPLEDLCNSWLVMSLLYDFLELSLFSNTKNPPTHPLHSVLIVVNSFSFLHMHSLLFLGLLEGVLGREGTSVFLISLLPHCQNTGAMLTQIVIQGEDVGPRRRYLAFERSSFLTATSLFLLPSVWEITLLGSQSLTETLRFSYRWGICNFSGQLILISDHIKKFLP